MPRTPGRLGRDFHLVLSAATATNVSDGIGLAAGPLLVATLTADPALVGLAVFVQQLPWLLFSLPAGAYVDRIDRRTVVVATGVARALLMGALAVSVATGTATIALMYAVLFAVGVAEVVADSAASALVPVLVGPDELTRANARMMTTFLVGNQFAGPPIGAWLFAAGAALPFAVEAAAFVLAAGLLSRVRRTPRPEQAERRERGWLRRDVSEGVRWLWARPTIRLLGITLCVMNVTYLMAFAAWVLYARERLGVSERGFGLLLTASAVGGLAGAGVATRLTERFGGATLLRGGLLVETSVHVVLALTRSPWVAGAAMAALGAHAAVWGIVSKTLRQRLTPDALAGRVNSAYFFLAMGGAAVGSFVGGFVAKGFGLAAPFWIAAGGDAVLVLVVWRRMTREALDPHDPSHAARDHE